MNVMLAGGNATLFFDGEGRRPRTGRKLRGGGQSLSGAVLPLAALERRGQRS